MKKRKRIFAFYIIFFVVFIILTRYKLLQLFNNNFNKKITVFNMTEKEKIEDFQVFYKTVTSSMPILDSIKDTYKIDFVNNKEKYISLIKNTKNDYEFFCAMKAIVRDIPSFHTDLCYPLYNSYHSLNCYNIDKVLSKRDIKAKADFWYKYIGEQCDEYDVSNYCFLYIDGNYIFDIKRSDDINLKYCKLISIDGIPIDEYVINNVSISKLEYDEVNKKAYRYCVKMNDKIGNKVFAEIEDEKGRIIRKVLRIDVGTEIAASYSYLYKGNLAAVNNVSVESKILNNIGYLKVNDFNRNYKKSFNNIIKNEFKECGNIIVDLRDNYGGNKKHINSLFEVLHKGSFCIENTWHIVESESNNVIFRDFRNILTRKYKNPDKSKNKIGRDIRYYKGNGIFEDTSIYYLIGKDTGSAADCYISDIKSGTDSVIIGDNTGGEGLEDSFVAQSLPNSGLVFIYMPGQASNPDGMDNSIHGTPPDIYIRQTLESYYYSVEMESDKNVSLTEKEELLMDNVLSETIQLIKRAE